MNIICRLYSLISPKRFKAALKHLELAYPDEPVTEHYRLLTHSLLNFVSLPLEWLVSLRWSDKEFQEHVKISEESQKNFQEAIDEGQGVLLLSGHHGNWEMGVRSIGMACNMHMAMVAKPLSPKWLNRFIEKRREAKGAKVIYKKGAAQEVLKSLKEKRSICVLMDQNRPDGIAAPLFGRHAKTTHLIPLLALKNDTPVVPAVCLRDGNGGYEMHFFPRVQFDEKTDNKEKNLYAMTTRCNEEIEKMIRMAPEQYLWTHLRYKSLDEGQTPLYD